MRPVRAKAALWRPSLAPPSRCRHYGAAAVTAPGSALSADVTASLSRPTGQAKPATGPSLRRAVSLRGAANPGHPV